MSATLDFLSKLQDVIRDRSNADPATSYTARLLAAGTKRIAQKVGEEGVEVALAAVAGERDELLGEAADLLYHLLVLLEDRDASLEEVVALLESRHS